MPTPESKVKAAIKRYLDSLGADCWHFSPMMLGYGRKGIPDIIGCLRGDFFAIEVKSPGNKDKTTPWQEMELDAIYRTRSIAIVADSVEDVSAILRKV